MQTDVAVIGGGPAGSTVAGLLAKRGYRVCLLEREAFPRYHIGESTVPGMLPVLEELGAFELIDRYGFTPKPGITFRWGPGRDPWSVDFSEVGPFDHAYQVIRSEFDQLLLEHARRLGATVLERATCTDVLFEAGRCVGVKYQSGSGKPESVITARFVVDASGQAAVVGRKLKTLRWDAHLKNLAIWTYYQGGRRLDGRLDGNILVENSTDGWLWVIPLHDGTQSVGWVTAASRAHAGRRELEQRFRRALEESTEASALLRPGSPNGVYRVARDWSYENERFSGPGFLLVGDAAGFVDPLFSTGVFLAMNAARLAARTVDAIFQNQLQEPSQSRRYDTVYKAFFSVVLSFVHYFYDASRQPAEYWRHAQRLIDPLAAMAARDDFIYLISGLHGAASVLDPQASRPEDGRLAHQATQAPMRAKRPAQVFDNLRLLLAKEPKRLQGIEGVYQFDLSGPDGGRWYVEIRNGVAVVGQGQATKADCRIMMRDADYVAMATGRLEGRTAFISRKLRVEGDVMLAMKARSIFG